MPGESRETWAKRVRRLEASGLRVADFARQIGVNARTLKWWRCRFRAEVSSRTKAVPPLSFVEVSAPVTSSRDEFEIVLRSDVRLRVPARFEDAALTRLLDLLEARR